MGTKFFDNYSLLHFAIGIIFNFFKIKFWNAFWIHAFFELFENTQKIMKWTNSSGWWPGGKPSKDHFINCVGDQISFMLGWYVAKLVNEMKS